VLQRLFHTAPLSVLDWAVLVGFGLLLLAADETRKAVVRARMRHGDPGSDGPFGTDGLRGRGVLLR
jgi:hypothetical protein